MDRLELRWLLVGTLTLAPFVAGVPGVVSADNEWASLHISASGGPETWLLAYQPFSGPLTSVAFSVNISVISAPSPSTATGTLIVLPTLARNAPEGLLLTPDGLTWRPSVLVVKDAGEGFSYHENYTLGAQTTNHSYAGVFVLVASTSSWNVHIRLTLRDEEGPSRSPEHIAMGDNVTLAGGVPHTNVLNDGSVFGDQEISLNISRRGWIHMELISEKLQPVAVRNYEIRFPNGFEYVRIGYRYGVAVGIFGTASITDSPDYIGSTSTGPGPLSARVSYVASELAVKLSMLHIPIMASQMPAGFASSNYTGFSSPFAPR